MKFNYKPKNNLEKFGQKIYHLLVDNSALTFFVGGTVRDILLKKKITDIDIATSLLPNQTISILRQAGMQYRDEAKNFGVITAVYNNQLVEITTLRKETYQNSRYPTVKFTRSPKNDSMRRDFTINSLYLQAKNNVILDFQDGLKDITRKIIRTIGSPSRRFTEDPLRMVRALRFCVDLKFSLDTQTKKALLDSQILLKNISATRLAKEINKAKTKTSKNILQKVINNQSALDKYLKKL